MNSKLAIIDNSIDHRIYDPVSHWKEHFDLPWQSFRAKESCFPSLKDGYSHLVLTGSEASILQREGWVYEEVEVVKEAVDKGLAVLGSCYGHQLIALALAGARSVRSCQEPEVGWIRIRFTDSNPLIGDIDEAHVFTSHFDEVSNLNDEFEVFAETESCRIQAFQLKDKPVWGIQPHPEMNIQAGQDYLRVCNPDKSHEPVIFEKALQSHPRDSGIIRRIAENFVRLEGKS